MIHNIDPAFTKGFVSGIMFCLITIFVTLWAYFTHKLYQLSNKIESMPSHNDTVDDEYIEAADDGYNAEDGKGFKIH
jgi:hypothetical protein